MGIVLFVEQKIIIAVVELNFCRNSSSSRCVLLLLGCLGSNSNQPNCDQVAVEDMVFLRFPVHTDWMELQMGNLRT